MRKIASLIAASLARGLQRAHHAFYQAWLFVVWVKVRHFDYVPRPTDIFIVTYPRSGTTWLQMILYQLSTDGSMQFDHISQVIPFFERMTMDPQRPHVEAMPSPRIFKSHAPRRGGLKGLPRRGCKYVYVSRNGQDVLNSMFHFAQTHTGFRGGFDEFFRNFMRGKVLFGSWFEHVSQWWSYKDDDNVLFITYEDLAEDPRGNIQKIAKFCGFTPSEEKLSEVVERCSFGFMKQHESQFDPLMETFWEAGLQLNKFLRQGQVGEGKKRLNVTQCEEFQTAQRRHLGPYTECAESAG